MPRRLIGDLATNESRPAERFMRHIV